MSIDSLTLTLLLALLGRADNAIPPEWLSDSIVVRLSIEAEMLVDAPGKTFVSRSAVETDQYKHLPAARHVINVAASPSEAATLISRWGLPGLRRWSGGLLRSVVHSTEGDWQIGFAVIHQSLPTHHQEARWMITHGLF